MPDKRTATADAEAVPPVYELPRDTKISARVPAAIRTRAEELAAYHGRSVSDEIVFALYLLDLQTVLAELQDPEVKKEMGAKKHTAAVKEVKADLGEAMKAALKPAPVAPNPALSMN
ncbi:MAG TPA: hypothetical protein VFN18_01250 [Solirubrobacterales bacterium]|nr:hypothetical protein [Solirubrobacterales bacterium]